jgi:AcrR family transcriptional regulator
MTSLKTFNNLPPAKQERIFQLALEEFSAKGYRGTSINVLVKRLAIAKGSIFQYFGDKQGLFLFVFTQAMEQVKAYLRTVREQTADADLYVRLRETLLAGVGLIRQQPQLYQLYLRILFEADTPLRDEILSSLRKASIGYIRDLLDHAHSRGELRPGIELDQTCFVLDALMDRFLQAQTVRHLDAGLGLFQIERDAAERWAANLVDTLRYGIGRAAPGDTAIA